MSTDLARLLTADTSGVRLVYGVATDLNTVQISGSTTAVVLPAMREVFNGDMVAVLVAGADMMILGPVDRGKLTLEGDAGNVVELYASGGRPFVEFYGGTDGERKMYVGYPDLTNDSVRVVADDGDLNFWSVTGDIILNDGYWGDVSALPTAWTNITTWADHGSNSWANYGGSWQTAQYRKHMDKVELRGLARNDGTLAATATVFTLPTAHRPPMQDIWDCQANYIGGGGNADDLQVRVTAYPTGVVRLEQTVDTGTSWLNLANISFSVTS